MGSAAICKSNVLRIAGLFAVLTASTAPHALVSSAHAQTIDGTDINFQASPDAQLLLTANELVFNQDSQTVIATGAVQVDYDGFRSWWPAGLNTISAPAG